VCIVFAFTDSTLRFASTVQGEGELTYNVSGDGFVEGSCRTLALPPWR